MEISDVLCIIYNTSIKIRLSVVKYNDNKNYEKNAFIINEKIERSKFE